MKVLKMLPVAMLLATGLSSVQAAADFVTLQRSQVNLSDGSPRLLVNFTLPATLNRSATTANSAVLDMDVWGSFYPFNEIYVNPPTDVCTSNTTDGNQPASIGFVRPHGDEKLRTEWATNHLAFSSGELVAGANRLMICIRSEDGDAGPNVGNLDNVGFRSIVLHYHTSD